MEEEKKEEDQKTKQEKLEYWKKVMADTKNILAKIVKEQGKNADLYQVNFTEKKWIKISGLEADLQEKAK